MLKLTWFFLRQCTKGRLPYLYVETEPAQQEQFYARRYGLILGKKALTIDLIMQVPDGIRECHNNSPWERARRSHLLDLLQEIGNP